MRLRTILVGVGGRGRWPVEVCGADERFEVVAVVDRNPQFLERAREDLSLPAGAAFDDLGAALQTVQADAVIICTPTQTHAPLSRIAFAAGKHVLVEKGMTFDWQDALALVREAEHANVRFCVAQNYRYHPTEAAITGILSDTTHPHHPGRVAIADLVHHRYRPDPRTLNYPFAMVWDMSCHHLDLLNAWLGPAERVTAVSSNPPWSHYEHDADIMAVIEYQSGVVCNYVLTHAATLSDYRLILQGARGALRAFDGPLRYYGLPSEQLGSKEAVICETQSIQVPRPRSEQGVIDDFYRFIVEGVEPGISGRNNLHTLAVCEMMVRSARERRSVDASELTL
ncbi:MAG TPA: Gfo/Idh/MocA family oxidoreductase [Armatimonadota bacterium]|nr:Gfo/Idh/MocA family oxidoreductase [Armatimonadota bacterium]